jgi:hypothetical protein
MMRRRFTINRLSLLALCCIQLGCSRPNRPATFPVHGTVTYRGKPVAGASVEFLTPGASRPATGVTDDSGHYRLTTFESDDGAIVGTHVVTVIKMGSPPVAAPTSGEAENNPAAIEKAMAKSAIQQRKARSELPAKYADRKLSDLHVDVAAHDNQADIKLSD